MDPLSLHAAEISTSHQIALMGPAQQRFDSSSEQATFFLNTYWPGWRSYDNPQSYLFPPVFKPKSLEMLQSPSPRTPVSANLSSPAQSPSQESQVSIGIADPEQVVYAAIQQLTEDGIQGPFLALHSVDLEKIRKESGHLLPNLENLQCPEKRFDFLLIGPKIGFVAIQVLSIRHEEDGGRFGSKSTSLPGDYLRSLAQLESVAAFLESMTQYTKVEQPNEGSIRKILFTPYLGRTRFEAWMTSLDSENALRLSDSIGKTKLWFKNDLANADSEKDKAPLYSALRQALESEKPLSRDAYEACGPIMASLASVAVLKNTPKEMELERSAPGDMDDALLNREHRRETSGQESKAFCLTPDQHRVLYGPLRQFILGSAGTGKTIALKAKALEVLRQNQSLMILTSTSYVQRYKEFFDTYGYKDVKVHTWPGGMVAEDPMASSTLPALLACCAKVISSIVLMERGLSADNCYRYLKKAASEHHEQLEESFKWLLRYDRVIFDDAFNEVTAGYDQLVFACAALMVHAAQAHPEKSIWVALDPYRQYNEDSKGNAIIRELLKEPSKEAYSVTVLRNVMRCPRNLFDAAYEWARHLQQEVAPTLRHTIQGSKVTFIKKQSKQPTDALWDEITNELKNFPKPTLSSGRVAVILGGPIFTYPESRHTLEHQRQVSIYDWDKVSSLEWPVVIYATCVKRGDIARMIDYQRYRAMTRATEKLIEIVITYDDTEPRSKFRETSELWKTKTLVLLDVRLSRRTIRDGTGSCVQCLRRALFLAEDFILRCFRCKHERMG